MARTNADHLARMLRAALVEYLAERSEAVQTVGQIEYVNNDRPYFEVWVDDEVLTVEVL